VPLLSGCGGIGRDIVRHIAKHLCRVQPREDERDAKSVHASVPLR
jgi:hypothetical protein